MEAALERLKVISNRKDDGGSEFHSLEVIEIIELGNAFFRVVYNLIAKRCLIMQNRVFRSKTKIDY